MSTQHSNPAPQGSAQDEQTTVHRIEQGSPSVAIGSYLQVLVNLGLEDGLGKAASVDVLGRKLQDLGLSAKKRVTTKKSRTPKP
ncbi:MAG: XRE family transcriptional regulator [bacterium]|nr:XRE family transcriptional regulator [bacterium]